MRRMDTVFPLISRPFGNNMYPAPKDPHWYLSQFFKGFNEQCSSGGWDYLKQLIKPERDTIVPCSQILNVFPFVSHTRGPGGAYCKEELVYKGKAVRTFVRSSKDIPIC